MAPPSDTDTGLVQVCACLCLFSVLGTEDRALGLAEAHKYFFILFVLKQSQ